MGPMLEYRVRARRTDAHGSLAATKDAEIVLDTALNGRPETLTRLNCSSPPSPPA